MITKIGNLRDLEYLSYFKQGAALTQELTKKYPKNEKLQLLCQAWTETCFHVRYLSDELRHHKTAMEDYRGRMNDAKLKAQDLEKENEDLKKELQKHWNFKPLKK